MILKERPTHRRQPNTFYLHYISLLSCDLLYAHAIDTVCAALTAQSERAINIHRHFEHGNILMHICVSGCRDWVAASGKVKGVDSRVSLLLSKQRNMETKATNTGRPFLPVAVLIQLDLGRQCL